MNEITNAAPQLVNLLEKGGVTPEQMEHAAQDLVGEYGWFVLAGFKGFLAKDMIMNIAQAVIVFMGNDFNNDGIIYISGRQARIVRVGMRNTCFYMTDRSTKMVVPNEQLKHLTIEKRLIQNGKVPYLPTAGEPGYAGLEEVPVNPPHPKPTTKKR